MSVRMLLMGALTTLVVLNVALGYVALTRDSDPSPQPGPSRTSRSAGAETSVSNDAQRGTAVSESTPADRIQLPNLTYVVAPHETVRVAGRLQQEGADGGRRVRVELWRRGAWRVFPVGAVTGPKGRFTAHVDLGEPGTHWLRVSTSRPATVSELFTVTVL